jgi:hypothetical protein
MRSMLLAGLGFAVITLGFANAARADSFAISSGAIHVDIEGDWFDLQGSGFTIRSTSGTGVAIPKTFDGLCFPCSAGDMVDLGFTTIGGDRAAGFGPATVAGVSYEQVYYRADLRVMADAQPFPATTDNLRLLQPFLFTGDISGYRDPDFTSLAFSLPLRGMGRAHTLFIYDAGRQAHFPEEGQIAYDFSPAHPVPEPATLLMLGAGLSAIEARRWRKRRRAE